MVNAMAWVLLGTLEVCVRQMFTDRHASLVRGAVEDGRQTAQRLRCCETARLLAQSVT
jgi:hypothetical protein